MDREELETIVKHTDLRPGRCHRYGFCNHGGVRLFVKVCVDERRLVRFRNEWRWLRRLAEQGLGVAPTVVGYAEDVDPYHAVLVTVSVPPLAASLGAALRSLHAMELSDRTIEFDGRTWASWAAFVEESAAEYIEGIREHAGQVPGEFADRVDALTRRVVSGLGDTDLALVHGDPTFENLVVDPEGRAHLIDLELSHVGDPLFDVATAKLLCFDGLVDEWERFTTGYGLPRSQDTERRIRFYCLLRQLRLARGRIWIHEAPSEFARAMERATQLLEAAEAREVWQ